MRVCYFGIYDPNYARNKILIKGLRQNNVEVIECRVDPKTENKYWKLYNKHKKIGNYDLMIVGFPGHTVMPLAKLVSRKKIVFDAFNSRYESIIIDRQKAPPNSFQAFKTWLTDFFSCRLADKVLLDTREHITFFIREFSVDQSKFKRIFVGADDDIFHPLPDNKDNDDKFFVHFHGTYIPLQGVEYIIEAASLLKEENIVFNLVGAGQTYDKVVQLNRDLRNRNVNFINFLPPKKLAEKINEANIGLGIFGKTPKAKRVIPNKAYEILAMKKPLITAETPASKELFRDKEHCLFCNVADAQDLAQKIIHLKDNFALCDRIAEKGYSLYRERLTSKCLGRKLKIILAKL